MLRRLPEIRRRLERRGLLGSSSPRVCAQDAARDQEEVREEGPPGI